MAERIKQQTRRFPSGAVANLVLYRYLVNGTSQPCDATLPFGSLRKSASHAKMDLAGVHLFTTADGGGLKEGAIATLWVALH